MCNLQFRAQLSTLIRRPVTRFKDRKAYFGACRACNAQYRIVRVDGASGSMDTLTLRSNPSPKRAKLQPRPHSQLQKANPKVLS